MLSCKKMCQWKPKDLLPRPKALDQSRKKLEDALREVELNCLENGVEITEEEIMNEVIRRMRK